MEVKLALIQSDIDDGERQSVFNCPVNLALRRSLNVPAHRPKAIAVCNGLVLLFGNKEKYPHTKAGVTHWGTLPWQVISFLGDWDGGEMELGTNWECEVFLEGVSPNMDIAALVTGPRRANDSFQWL